MIGRFRQFKRPSLRRTLGIYNQNTVRFSRGSGRHSTEEAHEVRSGFQTDRSPQSIVRVTPVREPLKRSLEGVCILRQIVLMS